MFLELSILVVKIVVLVVSGHDVGHRGVKLSEFGLEADVGCLGGWSVYFFEKSLLGLD